MGNNNSEKEFVKSKNSAKISNKLAAINNEIRFFIIEILLESKKKNNFSNPLYSREINSILLSSYGINITPQMLNQHLKQLVNAGLIVEVPTKKEVPNKIGKRNVKGYVLKEDAFEDLFLKISFMSEELLSFFELYEKNHLSYSEGCCVLTVFSGRDKGKVFKIQDYQTALIRVRGNELGDSISFDIFEGEIASDIVESHLKIFFEDESWCMFDESGSDVTLIDNIPIEKGVVVKLKNHSFLKFYQEESAVILYCSF